MIDKCSFVHFYGYTIDAEVFENTEKFTVQS